MHFPPKKLIVEHPLIKDVKHVTKEKSKNNAREKLGVESDQKSALMFRPRESRRKNAAIAAGTAISR